MKLNTRLNPVSKDEDRCSPPADAKELTGENSCERLRAIFESLEDEIIVIDENYRIIEANQAVFTRHGKSRAEVIGKTCFDISHGRRKPCHLPHHECPLKIVRETGQPTRVTHCHIYHVNGVKQEKYLDIIASPVKDNQGNVIAITEAMRDVTEAKKREQQAAEAYRNLLALNKIATAVGRSLDLDTVLSNALDKTLEIMNRNTGGILLWNEEKQMFCYQVHHSLSRDFVQSVCFRPGEGIVGRVAQSGKSVLIDDISRDPRVAFPGLIAAEGLRAFAAVPLKSKDKVLGVLTVASHDTRRFSSEDIQLLDTIASQIAIAVENAKLHQEMQRKDESRGELLNEIFLIQEEERRRIARELHDETSQSLASMAANLEAIAGMLSPGTDEIRTKIRKVEKVAISALDEIHKIIYELRPTLLDDLGLVPTVRRFAQQFETVHKLPVALELSGERVVPSHIRVTIFRAVQELLNNVARHAHAARPQVSV
ncbi:MAG: GAF domain-containing protein, partial [candidate division WOR-3 bacterium]